MNIKFTLRDILKFRILAFIYSPIRRWRMAKKIISFQTSQNRNFLISRNSTRSDFFNLASRFGSDKDGLLEKINLTLEMITLESMIVMICG